MPELDIRGNPLPVSRRIIVDVSKHWTGYYDASTPESFAASCLKILQRRFDEGWYSDPGPVPEEPGEDKCLSEQQIAILPTEGLRQSETKRREQELGRLKEDRQERDWYLAAKSALDHKTMELRAYGRADRVRLVPVVWELLEMHREYEYEGITLESLEIPEVTLIPLDQVEGNQAQLLAARLQRLSTELTQIGQEALSLDLPSVEFECGLAGAKLERAVGQALVRREAREV
jgi:hypothetical protein